MKTDGFDTKQGGSVGVSSTANESEGYSIYIKEWEADSEDGVQCSPDEARMIAKAILRHVDSVEMQREADQERKEYYRKREREKEEARPPAGSDKPGAAKTWEEWTAQARSMIATAATALELKKWFLRQSEMRHSLQPSQEEWENGLKKEAIKRIDELQEEEERDRPAAEEEIGNIPKAIKAWVESLITTMIDEDSAEKAIAQFRATRELQFRVLDGKQINFLTEMMREAKHKVLRPANPFDDEEPCPFRDDDEDERAGANGSSIDAAAVAKMVKDYNDRHPPAPDYTLAKYRTQTT